MTQLETVLLYHSLRNTIHVLYFALDLEHQLLSTPQANPKTFIKQVSEGSEWVNFYRKCLYCRSGEAGTQFLQRWLIQEVVPLHLHTHLF
ncbi:putative Proteasome subunit alpha type-2-like 3, partial [Homarus americanus]